VVHFHHGYVPEYFHHGCAPEYDVDADCRPEIRARRVEADAGVFDGSEACSVV
jgi:hypothetical protein